MAYLTLNGVTVPIAVESVSMSYEDAGGEQERSPAGELVGGPSVSKREWRMTTTPLPVSEVDAWVGLIEGAGHTFPFDADLYSARGRGTSSGTAELIVPGVKWGASFARLTTPNTVAWNLGFGSTWTVVYFWASDEPGATWGHRVGTSTGSQWADGAPAGPVIPLAEVSSGVLTIGDPTDLYGYTYINWDDVVALPYVVPDSWPAGMYARHSASAWSALPRVLAEGTFAAASVTVRGKVTGSKVIRYSRSGTLTAGHMLEFTLREV